MVAIVSSGAAVGVNFQQSYVVSATSLPEQQGQGIPLPGTTCLGTDGSLWVFVKVAASQTIAAGDFVYVSSTNATDWVVTSLTQSAGRSVVGSEVGVAGAAATTGSATVTASAYTGIWIMRAGRISANVANSSSTFASLYSTATAGRLNATASAGNNSLITGAICLAAPASNTAVVALNFPVVGANQ